MNAWRVTSDGGHLWLVMHNSRVVGIYREWVNAMRAANNRWELHQ